MNFKGKCAFITGVSHGIGQAIALRLAKEGANLFLCDINEEGLKNTAKKAMGCGVKVEYAVLDVSNEQAVNQTAKDAIGKMGKIDILINNAGIYNTYVAFSNSNSEDWRKKIEINLLGTMYLTRALINHMIDNNYGRIINIGSVAGVYGIANMVDYSVSKGAVISFSQSLAKEAAQYNITVNTVSPGSISINGEELPDHSFMGRAGTVDECANVVVFLASDEASYVSGQNYIVDGCRKKL